MVQRWQAHNPKALQLDAPPRRWENDPFLAQHEAIRMRATGDTRVRPIEELETIDPAWEKDVFNEIAYLRYLEDYYKLDPALRHEIENITAE